MNENIYTTRVYSASVYWFGKTDLDSLFKTLDRLEGGEVPEYIRLNEDLNEYGMSV